MEGLREDSLQGDKVVADIYAKYFGVQTIFSKGFVLVKYYASTGQVLSRIDFSHCPDLYPAVALTCEKLGIELQAIGIENLRHKESDRIEAVRLHEVRNDHRMAMALIAADYPVSIEEQACLAKSYPNFVPQHITPIKGVNDDNLGKKHALSKLIHAATSEYVWLHDDDVVLPEAVNNVQFTIHNLQADLVILPLKMESEHSKPSLIEQLQIAEYAAIQELTMRTAKKDQAIMCSGANLIVRREVWLECESELHPEIPSGDDMFLLEAVKRKGYTVGVIDEEEYAAIVRPATNWKTFWRQRMRWAGKAPHYTDKDILDYGKFIVVANVLQLLFFPIIFIKFPYEYGLIKARMSKNFKFQISNFKLFLIALLLEILYPIYLLICLIGGMNNKKEW